jgi:hypothetical protein
VRWYSSTPVRRRHYSQQFRRHPCQLRGCDPAANVFGSGTEPCGSCHRSKTSCCCCWYLCDIVWFLSMSFVQLRIASPAPGLAQVPESAGVLVFNVSMAAPRTRCRAVSYAALPGNATSPADFLPSWGPSPCAGGPLAHLHRDPRRRPHPGAARARSRCSFRAPSARSWPRGPTPPWCGSRTAT